MGPNDGLYSLIVFYLLLTQEKYLWDHFVLDKGVECLHRMNAVNTKMCIKVGR